MAPPVQFDIINIKPTPTPTACCSQTSRPSQDHMANWVAYMLTQLRCYLSTWLHTQMSTHNRRSMSQLDSPSIPLAPGLLAQQLIAHAPNQAQDQASNVHVSNQLQEGRLNWQLPYIDPSPGPDVDPKPGRLTSPGTTCPAAVSPSSTPAPGTHAHLGKPTSHMTLGTTAHLGEPSPNPTQGPYVEPDN